jgi:hypothetical protein
MDCLSAAREIEVGVGGRMARRTRPTASLRAEDSIKRFRPPTPAAVTVGGCSPQRGALVPGALCQKATPHKSKCANVFGKAAFLHRFDKVT